jgi:hypothetical protein
VYVPIEGYPTKPECEKGRSAAVVDEVRQLKRDVAGTGVKLALHLPPRHRGPARSEGEVNDTDARLWHPWLRINSVLYVMMGFTLAIATAGCSIGLALSQYAEQTELSRIDIGSTREEVERALGEPISQEVCDDGSVVATYRQTITSGKNEPFKYYGAPDPQREWPPWARAVWYFFFDIPTLGAMEIFTTPTEVGYKVNRLTRATRYDISVVYDSEYREVIAHSRKIRER